MLAILRPKHAGGTSESDKWLFVVNCAIVGLNAIQRDIILSAVAVSIPIIHYRQIVN